MNEERRKGDRRIPPAVAQHLVEERGELLARIAELTDQCDTVYRDYVALCGRVIELEAQPSAGVVLPEPVECGGLEDFADKKGERQITIDDRLYCDHYDDGSIEVRLLPDFVVYRADEVARLDPCLAQSVPDGYVMVPVEPTEEMREAANKVDEHADAESVWSPDHFMDLYRAMLAAACANHG